MYLIFLSKIGHVLIERFFLKFYCSSSVADEYQIPAEQSGLQTKTTTTTTWHENYLILLILVLSSSPHNLSAGRRSSCSWERRCLTVGTYQPIQDPIGGAAKPQRGGRLRTKVDWNARLITVG